MHWIKWFEGCLQVEIMFEHLSIRGSKGAIEVKPRAIIVRKADKCDIFTTSGEQYVYIRLRERLEPYTNCPDSVSTIERFSTRIERVVTSIGEYCTIVLPQYFNANYMIVGRDKVCIAIPLKRRISTEAIDDTIMLIVQ